MSPSHDERVELRVRTTDLQYWREAAEQAGVSLSDWIRRACFNALPDEMQMMLYRHDLAEKEKFEISVLERYLPQALTEQEIEAAIDAAIRETGAKAPADMGKVMGTLKGKLTGRADMGKVSARVKSKLIA